MVDRLLKTPRHRTGLSRLGFWFGLLPPLVAGIALRLFHIDSQVLAGDELHALNAAVSRSVPEIFGAWTFFGADYSVPLAAFYRALSDAGVHLSERVLRAPGLLAGATAIVALPALFAPRIGRRAALWLAWLLATSPMLVLYSRLVRSYMPMVLLSVAALLIFDRWWQHRSRAAAGGYVALAAASVYLHLGAAPFVLSPFVWAGIASLARGGSARPWRLRARELAPIAALAAATATALAVLLFPARESLVALVGLHGDGGLPSPETWLHVLGHQVGSRSAPVIALACAGVVLGGARLVQRAPAFAGSLLCAATIHLLALAIVAPHLFELLKVANRYVLPLLPIALALLALGLASPWSAADGGQRLPRLAQAAAVPACLALLFATGPLASERFRSSPFVHSETALTFNVPQDWIEPERAPPFYRQLSQPPPEGEALIEFPWMNVSAHAFDAYQRIHRRQVRVGSLNRDHGDPRLALRNTLQPAPEVFLASGARYLVVHVDLASEEARVHTRDPQFEQRLHEMRGLWGLLHGAGLRLAARLEAAWGPPIYRDTSLRVWDLEAVRGRLGRGPS